MKDGLKQYIKQENEKEKGPVTYAEKTSHQIQSNRRDYTGTNGISNYKNNQNSHEKRLEKIFSKYYL